MAVAMAASELYFLGKYHSGSESIILYYNFYFPCIFPQFVAECRKKTAKEPFSFGKIYFV
jgi:hypothetical protein